MDRYTDLAAALSQDLHLAGDMPLTSDMDPRTAAQVLLARSLLKKREDWPTDMLKVQSDRALAQFLASDDSCIAWNHGKLDHLDVRVDGDELLIERHFVGPDFGVDWGDDLFVGELQKFLDVLLNPGDEADQFDLHSISRLMIPGPGLLLGPTHATSIRSCLLRN